MSVDVTEDQHAAGVSMKTGAVLLYVCTVGAGVAYIARAVPLTSSSYG